MRGRQPIDRELERWCDRLAVIDRGLLACYETIDEGRRQKAAIEAKIATRRAATATTVAAKDAE